MKAKDLKAILNKLNDDEEIVLASVWSDEYGKGAELNGQITLYITNEGPIALIHDYSGLVAELRKYGIHGYTLTELENYALIVKNNKQWLKLLQQEKNDEQETTD